MAASALAAASEDEISEFLLHAGSTREESSMRLSKDDVQLLTPEQFRARYRVVTRVGGGAFAEVYKVEELAPPPAAAGSSPAAGGGPCSSFGPFANAGTRVLRTVALKVLSMPGDGPSGPRSAGGAPGQGAMTPEQAAKRNQATLAFFREARALKACGGCSHVVRFGGLLRVPAGTKVIYNRTPSWAIVLEYMEEGTLARHIHAQSQPAMPVAPPAQPPSRYSDVQALHCCLDLASAVAFLHASEPMLIHRDVKSSNVLLTRDPQSGRLVAKLSDLGLHVQVDPHTTAAMVVPRSHPPSQPGSPPTSHRSSEGGSGGNADHGQDAAADSGYCSDRNSSGSTNSDNSSASTAPVTPVRPFAHAGSPSPFAQQEYCPSLVQLVGSAPTAAAAAVPSHLAGFGRCSLPSQGAHAQQGPSHHQHHHRLNHGDAAAAAAGASWLLQRRGSTRHLLAAVLDQYPHAAALLRRAHSLNDDGSVSSYCAADSGLNSSVALSHSRGSNNSSLGSVRCALAARLGLSEAELLLQSPTQVWQTLERGDDPDFLNRRFSLMFDLTGMTGSLTYMAPEVFQHRAYNEAVDVFGLGVVMYELLARRLVAAAFCAKTQDTTLYAAQVAEGWRPPRPPAASDAVWALLQRCWAQLPEDRPPASQVVSELEVLLAEAQAAEEARGAAAAAAAAGGRAHRCGAAQQHKSSGGGAAVQMMMLRRASTERGVVGVDTTAVAVSVAAAAAAVHPALMNACSV